MPWKAQKIALSERQREVLERIVRRRTESQQLVQRVRIVVLAGEGQSNRAISREVGLERHQVGVWRNRWLDDCDRLVAAESESDESDYEELLRDALSDEPRSGCPPSSPPSRSRRSLPWPVRSRRNRIGRCPTGRRETLRPKSSNVALCRRFRPVRWGVF
jgi:hypothetical protein